MSGVGAERTRAIAAKVEAFVRNVVVPYEHDPRRDHHDCPSEELVAKTARMLADGPTGAIAGARALLLESSHSSLEGHLERETRSIAMAGGSAECREGVAAFLGRRKPDFSGEA